MPSRIFTNASTRAELRALITDVLPFANPYIIAGTPFLYEPLPGAAGATADRALPCGAGSVNDGAPLRDPAGVTSAYL